MPDAGIFCPDAGISFSGRWNLISETLEFHFRNAGIFFIRTQQFPFWTLEFDFRDSGIQIPQAGISIPKRWKLPDAGLADTGISFPERNYRTLEF